MIPIYFMLALLPNQVNPASYVTPVSQPHSPALRQMLAAESLRQRPLAIRATQDDIAKVEKKLATIRGRDLWSFLQPPRNADAVQECERTLEILHQRLERLQKNENACIPVLKVADWRVGRAGVLGFAVKVKEIRGPEAMLVEPQDPATDKTSPETFLLRGCDTGAVKIGEQFTPPGYFAVSGATVEQHFFSQTTRFVVDAIK